MPEAKGLTVFSTMGPLIGLGSVHVSDNDVKAADTGKKGQLREDPKGTAMAVWKGRQTNSGRDLLTEVGNKSPCGLPNK